MAVQAIPYSGGLSRGYVGGNGVVYVIDTVSYKLIDTVAIPAGANVTSIAAAGNLLFIGEGQRFGVGVGNNRLLMMDINPGSPNYNHTIALKNTGIESTPNGVAGLPIGPDGKALVVSAPTQYTLANLGDPTKRGDVLVFDLSTLDLQTGAIAAPIKADLPGGISPEAFDRKTRIQQRIVHRIAPRFTCSKKSVTQMLLRCAGLNGSSVETAEREFGESELSMAENF